MTNLPDWLARWRLMALALAFTLLVGGCGPGTGGTGTGPRELLTFTSTGSAMVSAPGIGASCPAGSCDRIDLRLEDSRIDLFAACRHFVFTGAWNPDAVGLLVLQGSVDTTAGTGTTTASAVLRLQFSDRDPADSAQVTATVSDLSGRVLVGPVGLQRGGAGPSPPCGAP